MFLCGSHQSPGSIFSAWDKRYTTWDAWWSRGGERCRQKKNLQRTAGRSGEGGVRRLRYYHLSDGHPNIWFNYTTRRQSLESRARNMTLTCSWTVGLCTVPPHAVVVRVFSYRTLAWDLPPPLRSTRSHRCSDWDSLTIAPPGPKKRR